MQDSYFVVAGSDRCTHNAGVPVPRSVKEDVSPAVELPASTGIEDVAVAVCANGQKGEVQVGDVCREFEFPGDLASVDESREQVMQFVSQHCLDEGDQLDILVATQEALVNAALHGCGDDPSKRIQCSVAIDTSDITITVHDPGPGFDLALADPENYAASTSSHGRGICLIRGLMTEVSFARGGSELRMRKHMSRCSP